MSETSKSTSLPSLSNGGKFPRLIYGTAWKGDETAGLVYKAIRAGFRGIDTAAQPKHYREDLVGQAIRLAITNKLVQRSDLFVRLCKIPPPSYVSKRNKEVYNINTVTRADIS